MSATPSALGARRSACFVVACLAWAFLSRATEQTTPTKFDFRIAAQPLDDALQEFSRQTGMQIIFFSRLTEGIQSPGVRGEYTMEAALKKLLSGSGLDFRLINDRAVSILRAKPPKSPTRAE